MGLRIVEDCWGTRNYSENSIAQCRICSLPTITRHCKPRAYRKVRKEWGKGKEALPSFLLFFSPRKLFRIAKLWSRPNLESTALQRRPVLTLFLYAFDKPESKKRQEGHSWPRNKSISKPRETRTKVLEGLGEVEFTETKQTTQVGAEENDTVSTHYQSQESNQIFGNISSWVASGAVSR